MIYQGKKGYPVREVILHTAATPGDWHKGKSAREMRDEIRRWHVEDNGWRDIGYHRVIAPNGDMALGRSLWEVGAHVRGHNRGTIGICLIPSATHDGIRAFDDYFTHAQEDALKAYIQELLEWTGIQIVSGHNDYAPKECPGFRVRTEDWL